MRFSVIGRTERQKFSAPACTLAYAGLRAMPCGSVGCKIVVANRRHAFWGRTAFRIGRSVALGH